LHTVAYPLLDLYEASHFSAGLPHDRMLPF